MSEPPPPPPPAAATGLTSGPALGLLSAERASELSLAAPGVAAAAAQPAAAAARQPAAAAAQPAAQPSPTPPVPELRTSGQGGSHSHPHPLVPAAATGSRSGLALGLHPAQSASELSLAAPGVGAAAAQPAAQPSPTPLGWPGGALLPTGVRFPGRQQRGSHVHNPLVRILPSNPLGAPSFSAGRGGVSGAPARGALDVPGRAPAAADIAPAATGRGRSDPVRRRANRGKNRSYNKFCATCNQEEGSSKRRFLLCEDKTDCSRWVHKRLCLPSFNTFAPESERCCSHHATCKSKCICKMCKEQRSKARGGSRGGRAGGRGGVAPRSGQGRGHAARNGQGRGHAGRRGAGGEAKQRQRVFKLPRGNGDQSTTVAVRLGNADNWVITSVNPERQTSSCSRTQCQGLRAGLVAQQQTAGSHGGVASAIGGLCKHAKAALEHMRKKTVKDAREVKGDGWDWDAAKEHVATAKSDGHLSVVEHTAIMTMVERAEGSGVWPVYETEPNHFVVRDDRTRTSEHDYACVKYDTVEPGKSSRRLTPPKNFMCRAAKGEACTENTERHRQRCVHTLIVALFSGVGQHSTASPGTGEGAAAGEPSGGSLLPRTPRALLEDDEALYCRRLQDTLVYMSRHQFPPAVPSGLRQVVAEPGTRFTVSQTRCTCGGELRSEGDVEDAKLVTEAPLVTSVTVERRKCGECGMCAWASDNWRDTSVFNFNNNLLVDLALLYKCLAQFIGGTPIQTFFFAHFEPLTTNLGWLSANPDLAASITDKNSRFFVQLTNAFLGFLGLVDFPFEFRCFQWSSHSPIVTVDACVKMCVNSMTKALAAASRPESTLNFDMSMVCLKLCLVSTVFFSERVQFVLGDLEGVGRTPAWVSPENRLFERGIKTERAVVKSLKWKFEDGERAKLMKALNDGAGGISQVDGMGAEELKDLHLNIFGTRGSYTRLKRKEDYVEKFHLLFEHGDCSKLFLGGRGGVATAGMVCAFTPAGVMVAWKVLPTPESVYDVVDFMRWMKVKPLFLCYDAACKLVAGLEKYCPGLLDNEGILKRDTEGNVVFPELEHVGNNRDSATREIAPCAPFQERERTTDDEDVYAVMETAGPRPGLQSEVDPYETVFWAASFFKRVGEPSKLAAMRAVDALRRDGVRLLSLFEVLVFTYHWHRRAAGGPAAGGAVGGGSEGGPAGGAAGGASEGGTAGEATGGLVVGAKGWVVHTPMGAGEGDIITHADGASFLLPVLVALSGSRQASKVSALPSWLDPKWISEGDVATGLRGYAEAKEKFVVDGLRPLTPEARQRAGIAVRGGIGFGRGVFTLKSLELGLAPNAAPHETTTGDKMAGYDATFHDTRYQGSEGDAFPRKMRIGPDGHHESNHGPECRAKYSGMTTCKDIAGVNLTRHESDHGVKAVYFRSINNMTFPNFTYSLSVINELQNRKYNKQFLGVLLKGIAVHTPYSVPGCHAALWTCGRCFCSKPLVRVFDCFGRLDLVFLSSVMER